MGGREEKNSFVIVYYIMSKINKVGANWWY